MTRWTQAGGPYQFPFMGAASRSLKGERDIDCPKCGAAKLRSYFHVFDREAQLGSIWVWCPACKTTDHLRRVKPSVDLGVDPFGQLSDEQFSAINRDQRNTLLDRLDRMIDRGELPAPAAPPGKPRR